MSDRFLRVLGAEELLVGAQVLEVLPRRVGGGGGGGGLLLEAQRVIGQEHSIDHPTVSETYIIARLAALDQYLGAGQAKRQSGDRERENSCRVGPEYLHQFYCGLDLEECLFPRCHHSNANSKICRGLRRRRR